MYEQQRRKAICGVLESEGRQQEKVDEREGCGEKLEVVWSTLSPSMHECLKRSGEIDWDLFLGATDTQ